MNIQTTQAPHAQIVFRNTPTHSDKSTIIDILNSSGYFYDHETMVAGELIDENLEKGAERSGYNFMFADYEGKTVGFTCYGPIACTESSHDLFWIAVHKDFMFKGIGKQLIQETEKCVKKAGGTRIYIETSGRELYKSTRGFYLKTGYILEAELEDFYGPGDSKMIYVKKL